MSAEVETMFSVRETPWHGMGTIVEDAPTSEDAIRLAGLDWDVKGQKVFTSDNVEIPGAIATVRTSDGRPLGLVTERYKIVQNRDAFAFTDALLGEGVTYETAGSLFGGKVVWLLARMPGEYKILGDKVDPYMVFTNSHDGSGAVRVAMTPIRVVCKNTLNAALRGTKRMWSAKHTGKIEKKLEGAMQTFDLARMYMETMEDTFEELYKIPVDEDRALSLIENLAPIEDFNSPRQIENIQKVRGDIFMRWEEAPDLKNMEKTGARFIQAVADTTSHMDPLRNTVNFAKNKFRTILNGNPLLDNALEELLCVA